MECFTRPCYKSLPLDEFILYITNQWSSCSVHFCIAIFVFCLNFCNSPSRLRYVEINKYICWASPQGALVTKYPGAFYFLIKVVESLHLACVTHLIWVRTNSSKCKCLWHESDLNYRLRTHSIVMFCRKKASVEQYCCGDVECLFFLTTGQSSQAGLRKPKDYFTHKAAALFVVAIRCWSLMKIASRFRTSWGPEQIAKVYTDVK